MMIGWALEGAAQQLGYKTSINNPEALGKNINENNWRAGERMKSGVAHAHAFHRLSQCNVNPLA